MIETERMIIRKFRPADFQDLFEYLSLAETYRFEPGEPITIDEVKHICIQRANSDNFFAVELKQIHKMIGHLYFNQISPDEYRTWELGYIFNPVYQNKGYCTEASQNIIAFAFKELHAHKIIAFCNPNNIASWRVLEKAGLQREGFFKQKAFFKRDAKGNPIWHDSYAYGLVDADYHNQLTR